MGLIDILHDPSSFKYKQQSQKGTTDPYPINLGKGYPLAPTSDKGGLRDIKYGDDRPGGGSSKSPLIVTPLPSLDSAPNPTTLPDGLYRGQGVLTKAKLDDTKRISKFLITEQGLQFLAKQQALQFKENLSLYGNNPKKWKYNNPASYVAQTALAGTGIHIKNTFSIGGFNQNRDPRVSKYGEAATSTTAPKLAASLRTGTDLITNSPMYIAESSKTGLGYDDTVDFHICKINNDGTGNNTYIHFRSYIKGLSDGYNAIWKSSKYMGRGEEFFSYNGFKRDISFDFEVPVLSRREQSQVYSKLNYLASLMAPDYTDGGFMRGNLVKITIGDYITDLPGVLTGIDFKIDEGAGWDIARDNEGNKIEGDYVMPKLISVGGFKFLPIHNFVPKTVQSKFIETGDGKYNDSPFISFGKKGKIPSNSGGYNFQPDPETARKAAENAFEAAKEGPLTLKTKGLDSIEISNPYTPPKPLKMIKA